MWSRRAQEYEQKINSGKIYELAEVVKDLNKTSNTIADQSYKLLLQYHKCGLKDCFMILSTSKSNIKY